MTGPLESTPPVVSAVIVSYNTREHLLRCLSSLSRHVTLSLEVIVVDNGSSDGSVEAVRRDFPGVRVLENGENLGFARANNRGVREARGCHALILNSDAEVRPGAVEAMISFLETHGDVAIVGPRTLNSDGTVQVSFGPDLTPLAEWRQRRLVRGVRARRPEALRRLEALCQREQEPVWVSGACLLARVDALRAVDGFDEGFFLYEEDVDLCVRVHRAGWRIVYSPAAEVVHHLGRSMEKEPWRAGIEYHRSHLRYYRKHHGSLPAGLLRLYLLTRSLLDWLSALGPGSHRGGRRRAAREVLRLVWLGR